MCIWWKGFFFVSMDCEYVFGGEVFFLHVNLFLE
jgi:hypothetical protein